MTTDGPHLQGYTMALDSEPHRTAQRGKVTAQVTQHTQGQGLTLALENTATARWSLGSFFGWGETTIHPLVFLRCKLSHVAKKDVQL